MASCKQLTLINKVLVGGTSMSAEKYNIGMLVPMVHGLEAPSLTITRSQFQRHF